MKIVICPDSFKGSLAAEEVAEVISKTIKEHRPEIEILEIPLADGGEGTANIMKRFAYPMKRQTLVHDPLCRKIITEYFTDPSGEKVFIESAKIIGLPLLKEEERNPLKTSSYGLGEVILDACRNGGKEITVSLGGSATCDGGKGMLEALGDLNKLKDIRFNVVCDVVNPLLGENGAVKVFAPQKGAKTEDLPLLEAGLEKMAKKLLKKSSHRLKIDAEGGGAAGGLGFAFMASLNAKMIKGINFVLEILDFPGLIEGADMIITGEGKIDSQSLMGKVVSAVLSAAKEKNIQVIAFCGIVEEREKLMEAGLNNVYEIRDPDKNIQENMNKFITKNNLRKMVNFVLKSNIF